MRITITLSADMIQALQMMNGKDRNMYLNGLVASEIKHSIREWGSLVNTLPLSNTTFTFDFEVSDVQE